MNTQRTVARSRRTMPLVAASAVLAAMLPLAAVQAAPQGNAAGNGPGSRTCATNDTRPAPLAQRLQDDPTLRDKIASNTGRSPSSISARAKDKTLWADGCGDLLYADPAVTAPGAAAEHSPSSTESSSQATAAAAATTALQPLSSTFALESNPGAPRTLYLDFDGERVAGTAWNNEFGVAEYVVAPFSIDADTTTFSNAELVEIQETWQLVAEDYAPFNINVTTRDLGAAALDRATSTDTVYGTRVLFSARNAIYDSCVCGGIAYVNVFNLSGSQRNYYAPAWVFTPGTGTDSKAMGEAASHEAGHNFGLDHDGTSTSGYYTGARPWAPTMGAGYYQPITQWSSGEYASASNRQDDLAVIATGAPFRADDVAGTTTAAAVLPADGVNGVISTRSDTDVYALRAAGATTVALTTSPYANLDASLTVLDAAGNTLAVVDPAATYVSANTASGMGASWSGTLPTENAQTLYLRVDGVGTGDPLAAGRYSDYGSLGFYRLSASTQPPTTATPPLTLTSASLPSGTVGNPYSATAGTASGGTIPYTWTATGLPPGISISSSDGTLAGTPTVAGNFTPTVTVRDSSGSMRQAQASVVVNPAPLPPVTTADRTFAGTTGVSFSAQLVATGGDSNYTWSATTTPPPGLSLSSNGVLAGSPTTTGTFSFTARVSSAGTTATGLITVQVQAPATSAPSITTTTLTFRKVKGTQSASLSATGGSGRLTWSVAAGQLPPGMTLTQSSDGRAATLSGTPHSGTWTFTLRVQDTAGAVGSRSYTVRFK